MRLINIVAAAILAAVSLAACDGGDKIDTAKLEKSFASAPPEARTALDEVKSAAAAKDYARAGQALGKLAQSTRLTEEQKRAINDLAQELKGRITQTAKDTLKEGEKAIGDLQRRLAN